MKPWFRILLPLFALSFASGCLQVDYFGQSFDPTPETSPVEYYTSREEIPAGRYRIIGRGIIVTEMRVDKYDIREALVREARKNGADAVAAVSVDRKKVGVYPQENGFDDFPTSPTNAAPETTGKALLDPNAFTSAELHGGVRFRVETHVRALFLKDKATLEQVFARRGKELDELVKQPDPKEAKFLTEAPAKPETSSVEEVKITGNPPPGK